jgi:hypothetical protein
MMKLYELMYNYDGPETRLYSIGQLSLKPRVPTYLYEDELPISLYALKKLKDITIKEAKLSIRPKQALVEAKVLRGSCGIVWEGNSPMRATNYGDFKRGEVHYELDATTVSILAGQAGFRKIVE